ncbi:MAG TPA: hypothetical protein VFX77_04650 [Rubrobacter sp.]|nr:hypothetical protein [Rubrobacter sp.]HYQ85411.1 hypothetical protein [Rubrobacter sp.]
MNVIVILVDNLNRHHLPAYGGGPRPWEPSTSSSTARRTLTSNETCGTTSQESAQGC